MNEALSHKGESDWLNIDEQYLLVFSLGINQNHMSNFHMFT